MEFSETSQIIFQLFLATLLGGLIGLEREAKRKEAGLQTYSLVTLGTCLFTIISFHLFKLFFGTAGVTYDPAGIISAITIGIGFIGAGAIFRQPSGIVGITTAAGLWTAAAIGIAVGANFYLLAILGTFFTILILAGLGLLEEKIFVRKKENGDKE